jgi:hypothetical protein
VICFLKHKYVARQRSEDIDDYKDIANVNMFFFASQCFCNSGFALISEGYSYSNGYHRKIKPHQFFAAGDLGDSHGTHEVCLNLFCGRRNSRLKLI